MSRKFIYKKNVIHWLIHNHFWPTPKAKAWAENNLDYLEAMRHRGAGAVQIAREVHKRESAKSVQSRKS